MTLTFPRSNLSHVGLHPQNRAVAKGDSFADQQAIARITPVVQQYCGLSSAVLGERALLRALRQGFAQSGLNHWPHYLQQVTTSPSLLEVMVECLVVPETWFFREPLALEFLQRWAKRWRMSQSTDATRARSASSSGKILRLLSLPCSTGEEPYSMAIALLEAGLQPEQFSIDAIDLSRPLLTQAKRGLYRQSAFREPRLAQASISAESVQQYFSATPNARQLNARVRATVQFFRGNLLKTETLPLETYDGIFCRNLLIYFEKETRDRALAQLHRLVKSSGFVVFGSADLNPLDAMPFTPWTGTPAYRPKRLSSVNPSSPLQPLSDIANAAKTTISKTPGSKTVGSKAALSKTALSGPLSPASASASAMPITSGRSGLNADAVPAVAQATARSQAGPRPQDRLLMKAEMAADQGNAEMALELCEDYLRLQPLSADAYCLLGEIHQMLENPELALICFGRSLYLDPLHSKALLHTALLCEQQGDEARAHRLRGRLSR